MKLKKKIKKNNPKCVILPIYLYDHSGIAISNGPFSCKWDSGLVGYIFASLPVIRDNYGFKIVTKKRREWLEGLLKAETETYNQYLQGDVYGFEVKDEDGNVVGSCWGFYGDNPEKNGMKEHLTEYLPS